MEDFKKFQSENSAVLDARYRRELELASTQVEVSMDGSCGLCLKPAVFLSGTAHGEMTQDGRILPNWREEQFCSCDHRLNNRQRAILHLLLPRLGAPTWYRMAIMGEPDAVSQYLSKILPNLEIILPEIASAGGTSSQIRGMDARYHLILSSELFHRVPLLDSALGECARLLTPGGIFVFTVPFTYTAESTVSDYSGFPSGPQGMPSVVGFPVHTVGWDITDRVLRAGFVDCVAFCYWSEELGYLGAYNIIFFASK